jgi:hypothetical protein
MIARPLITDERKTFSVEDFLRGENFEREGQQGSIMGIHREPHPARI